MSRPTNFVREAHNNENLETTFAFKWLPSQWPMPTGSYFEMDVRADPNGPAILRFASDQSPRTGIFTIATIYDSINHVMRLGILVPKDIIEPLFSPRHYLFDITLTRPRGNQTPRVDVIGTGFLVIKKGITHG